MIAIPLQMHRSFNISLHLLHPAPVGLTTAPLHLRNKRLNLKLQLSWTLQPHHVPEMPPNLTQSPALRHSSLPHLPIRPPRHPLLKTKTRALRISPLLGAEKGNFVIEPSDPVFPQPFFPQVIAPCLVTSSPVEIAIPISPDLKFRIHPRNVDLNSFLGLEMLHQDICNLLRSIFIGIPNTGCFGSSASVGEDPHTHT